MQKQHSLKLYSTFSAISGLYRHAKVASGAAILVAALAALVGCGGGGGGGGNNNATFVTVQGTVLSAVNYTAPTSPATVNFGSKSLVTNSDGTFTTTLPSNATSATVSATGEVTRTIHFTLVANQINNLGNIFLADTGTDYSANVSGVVVTAVKGVNQPVTGATVTIGNITGTSAANGTFVLTGLPVGLGSVNGLYGTVTAKGYATKLITADVLQFALASGANNLGDLVLAKPSGTTPSGPYTVTGTVTVQGAPVAGVTVTIAVQSAGSQIATTTTDSTGTYYFWVAPAPYLITAQDAAGTVGSANVTLNSLTTPVSVPAISLAP